MDRLGVADRLTQLSPRIGEDRAHPHDRVVNRPRRCRDPEHLNDRLADLVTREPEHAGEHRDMRIDTRPEPRQSTRRQPRERRLLTRRANATAAARARTPTGGSPATRTADDTPDRRPAPRCHQTRARNHSSPGDAKRPCPAARVRQAHESCPDAPVARQLSGSSACTPPAPHDDAQLETPEDHAKAACCCSPSRG